MTIKSILVDGQGYYYTRIEEIKGSLYFYEIYLSDDENWYICKDYDEKTAKRVNSKYVIEINYE